MAVVVRSPKSRWFGGITYYEFSSGSHRPGSDVIARVRRVMTRLFNETGHAFIERGSQKDFVRIWQNTSTSGVAHSSIGRKGGRQGLDVSASVAEDIILHELLHTLGFAHEHARTDRKGFVHVEKKHYDPRSELPWHNWERVSASKYENVTEYDYDSIMHYSAFLGSKIRQYNWSDGWSQVDSFTIDGDYLLIFYHRTDGRIEVDWANDAGGLGPEIEDFSVPTGFRDFVSWRLGKTYLFFQYDPVTGRGETRKFRSLSKRTEFGKGVLYPKGLDIVLALPGGRLFSYDTRFGYAIVDRFNADGALQPGRNISNMGPGWQAGSVFTIGILTFLLLMKSKGPNTEIQIFPVSSRGVIGEQVHRYPYIRAAGWNKVETYVSDGNHYAILMNAATGKVVKYPIETGVSSTNFAGLKIGDRRNQKVDYKGWENVRAVAFSGGVRIVFIKGKTGEFNFHAVDAFGDIADTALSMPVIAPVGKGTLPFRKTSGLSPLDRWAVINTQVGNVYLHKIDRDGAVGDRIFTSGWSDGWTHAKPFVRNGRQYILFYKLNSGHCDIHEIDLGSGSIGPRVFATKWGKGWEVLEPFHAGNGSFLFSVKPSTGQAVIERIGSRGSIGAITMKSNIGKGNDAAAFYEASGNPYMIVMNKSKGGAAVVPLYRDGTFGRAIVSYPWNPGWSHVRYFKPGNTGYLFFLKEDEGVCDIHRVNRNGTVGTHVKRYTGWDPTLRVAEIQQAFGKTWLIMASPERGAIFVNQLRADGLLGKLSHSYTWDKGWSAIAPYQSYAGPGLLFLNPKTTLR